MDELDAIDIKILNTLQERGNITNLKLSELVGLSPSPCLQRVKRLRKAGYIIGYNAQINAGKILASVVIYTKITLSEQTVRQYSIFENAIKNIHEIIECSLMSGEFNYLLKIICVDINHYNELMQTMMEMDIGIKAVSMFVEIRNVKREASIPLATLLSRQRTTG